jgi:hypothetical protein
MFIVKICQNPASQDPNHTNTTLRNIADHQRWGLTWVDWVDSGADAVVVSNHGGRQLDGAASTVSALPAVVDAVGARTEVWMDGGVRSGQDVLKRRRLHWGPAAS